LGLSAQTVATFTGLLVIVPALAWARALRIFWRE